MDVINRNPDIEKAEELCEKCIYCDLCKEYEKLGVLRMSVHDRTLKHIDCHLFVSKK